jgi:hypothetical protein
LNQFLDFQIVFDKTSGNYYGINYTGSLEGSTTPFTYSTIKNDVKAISIKQIKEAFESLVKLEAMYALK